MIDHAERVRRSQLTQEREVIRSLNRKIGLCYIFPEESEKAVISNVEECGHPECLVKWVLSQ